MLGAKNTRTLWLSLPAGLCFLLEQIVELQLHVACVIQLVSLLVVVMLQQFEKGCCCHFRSLPGSTDIGYPQERIRCPGIDLSQLEPVIAPIFFLAASNQGSSVQPFWYGDHLRGNKILLTILLWPLPLPFLCQNKQLLSLAGVEMFLWNPDHICCWLGVGRLSYFCSNVFDDLRHWGKWQS